MRANPLVEKPHTPSGLRRLLNGEPVKAITVRDFEALLRWFDPDALGLVEWTGESAPSHGDPNLIIREQIHLCQSAVRRGDLSRAVMHVERLQALLEGKNRPDIDLITRVDGLVQISDFYVHSGDRQKELFYAQRAKVLCESPACMHTTSRIEAHSRHLFAVFHRAGADAFFRLYSEVDAQFELRSTKPEAAAWHVLAKNVMDYRPKQSLEPAARLLNQLQMEEFASWTDIAAALCGRDSGLLWTALEARMDHLHIRSRSEVIWASRDCLDIASLWLRSLGLQELFAFTRQARENLGLQFS
ncbi:MAG: hypothetical protein SFV32_01915 [Opitutaceae bacterium]|nr:hypothetical protein [Opitutaceae bacterium]